MPRHSRPRARVTFSESAEKQIEVLTDEAELLALDRALTVLSVDPDAGAPIPGSHPGLRDYRDDVDDVRTGLGQGCGITPATATMTLAEYGNGEWDLAMRGLAAAGRPLPRPHPRPADHQRHGGPGGVRLDR